MKKTKRISLIMLALVLMFSSSAFAAHYPTVPIDHNMESYYDDRKPNSDMGPVVCRYFPGTTSSQTIKSETWVSVATDMTGSANVYMKGQNGVIRQRASSTISDNYVKSGVANITGCYTAEYVEHYAVRTYYVNGQPSYADDWEYRYY